MRWVNGSTITVTATSSSTAPIVTSSAATSISTTNATLNGNVTSDGGVAVAERGFAYKTSAGVTINDNKTTVSGTTGSFNSPVTNLGVNVQYFFKAFATNTIGTTLSSPELNFWTLANPPTAPTVGNPTISSLDVTIGSGDGNPPATTYAIQNTDSGNYVQGGGSLGVSAVYQDAATWGTKTVSGLSSSTAYTFQVKARNGANTDTAFGPTGGGTTSASGTPTISAGSVPAFGNVEVNTASVTNSYNLLGTTLTPASGSLTVTPPAGFEVSTDQSTWTVNPNSMNVAYSGGELASTPIHVRFKPAAGAAYSGNITNAGGGAADVNRAVSGTGYYSTNSDIIVDGGFSASNNIAYPSYQEADLTPSSLTAAQFVLRDGGGSADVDSAATTLTNLTFSVANSTNLRRVALYDGATELREVAAGATITFTNLNVAATDGGSKTLTLRASFQSTVTDNQQIQFTVSSAQANSALGSIFAAANAGGAASSISGDDNRIEVTATKLAFSSTPTGVNANQNFSVTVQAQDANNRLDLDNTASVTITKATGGGTLTGGGAQSLVSGTKTFSTMQISAGGGSFTLSASDSPDNLSDATSSGIFAHLRPLAISGYLANPVGSDGPHEYVQLTALEPVDFSVTPMSVVWANNGSGTANGWVEGLAVTYKFNITSGTMSMGDVAYVGGSGKLLNGVASTDIQTAQWLRTIDTSTTSGDGFGTSSGTQGNLGNGGPNADGVAVFLGTSPTDTTVPVDAVFFGTGIGTALVSGGSDGYELPVNDLYNGGFLQSGSTFFGDPQSGVYAKLNGVYDPTSSSWVVARTATAVTNPTVIGDIATGVAVVSEPTTPASGVSFFIVTNTSMTVSWTSGSGSNRIVVVRAGSATSFTPSDFVAISGVNVDFSTATDQGGGNKICYAGSGSSFSLTGLSGHTTYHVTVFEYNGTGSSANYLTTGTPATGSQVTSNTPPAPANNSYTRSSNIPMKVKISDLLANDTDADGDTVSFVGQDSVTTNNLPLFNNGTYIFVPANNVADGFSYRVQDNHLGTNPAFVSLTTVFTFGQLTAVTPTSSNAVVTFYGVPGVTYYVQRDTNTDFGGAGLSNFPGIEAPVAGGFQVIDDFHDLGTPPWSPPVAYYRLIVP